MDLPERTLGVRPRPRRALAPARGGAVRPHDPRPVRARDAGQRHRRHGLLSRLLVPAHVRRARASSPASALLLHFGAVDYAATVWVNGALAGAHEGGYTPFCADITDAARRGAAQQSVVVRAEDDPHDLAKPRGKQDWQLRAALDLVSAHHRHLADGVAGARAGDAASARCAGRRTSSAGRSASRRASTATRRDGPARSRVQPARRRARCSPTTRYARRSAARCTAASRSPTPASTTTATSCSGARTRPTLIDAELELLRRGGDADRRGRELHRAALDRRAGRPLRAQRPAVSAAHGARPGLLARDAG